MILLTHNDLLTFLNILLLALNNLTLLYFIDNLTLS